MKKKLFSITTGLLNLSLAFAQVTNSGANIVLSQNTYLVLGDMSIVNNGTFNQTAGTVKFIGSNNNTIAGSTFPKFFKLEINKTGGAQVQLQSRINIAGEILFSSGLLNLNNNNIILTANAVLNNENENNHITGTGGYIEASANLSAPNSANPGNLGAIISSPQNLGATTIRRGHQVQTIGSQSSVKRYFDINPSINSLLNATLRFTYLDAELNGLNENTALLWKSTDNINWSEIGFDSRNITSNYVEKIGIADFSRWTLTGTTNPCETMQTFYADADSDGYGTIAVTIQACTSPAGYVSNSDDCNDNNASVYPGAMEVCNGIDDNCNGQINEGCPATPTVSINDVTVYESQGQAVLTVSLSKPAITALKVNFKTIDGTAVKSKDYKNTNGGITIAAGSVSALITIPIMQDNINEASEYFDVQISLPKVNGQQQAATIIDDMGRITILNGVAPALTKTFLVPGDSKSPDNKTVDFNIIVTPNPSQSDFILHVQSSATDPIDITIFDVQGRKLKQMRSFSTNVRLGSDLRSGVYLVEVRQQVNKRSIKLIKL